MFRMYEKKPEKQKKVGIAWKCFKRGERATVWGGEKGSMGKGRKKGI